jgi:hypothetical protein
LREFKRFHCKIGLFLSAQVARLDLDLRSPFAVSQFGRLSLVNDALDLLQQSQILIAYVTGVVVCRKNLPASPSAG